MHQTPTLTTPQMFSPLLVAAVWIGVFSLLREPARQKLSALMLCGAGAAYLSGGLGRWEFAACTVFTFLSYRGLANYRYLGAGWFLHTCWDLAHHFYGNPIVPFAPSSSAGCAICDTVLAVWYFAGAPAVFPSRRPAVFAGD